MEVSLERDLGLHGGRLLLGHGLARDEFAQDLHLHALFQRGFVAQSPQGEHTAHVPLSLGPLQFAGHVLGVGGRGNIGFGRALQARGSHLGRGQTIHNGILLGGVVPGHSDLHVRLSADGWVQGRKHRVCERLPVARKPLSVVPSGRLGL